MTPAILGLDFLDAEWLITWFGPFVLVGIAAIIFVETALIVLAFLPGDSLLFTVGLLTATGFIPYDIWVTCIIIFVAAFAGDQVAYFIGRKAGPAVFSRERSRLFNPANVDRTNEFFRKYGGKAVILARFLPIFRAFVPVAAGVGRMNYRTFVTYNVIGAFLWGVGLTLVGFFLGQIQFVQDYAEYIILGIVLLSGVPLLLEIGKAARSTIRGRRATAAENLAAERIADAVPEELRDPQR